MPQQADPVSRISPGLRSLALGVFLAANILWLSPALRATADPTDDPLSRTCVTELDQVLAGIAGQVPSSGLLPKLQQLRNTVKKAVPRLTVGEQAKFQVLLEEAIEPAIVELAQEADRPPSDRARRAVRRARTQVAQPAPTQPLLSGKIEFETSQGRKCTWDLGTLVQSLQRMQQPPTATTQRKATAADIATIRAFIASGKGAWLPNLREWFRFKRRPMTPESISRRVAGFLEDYLAHPANLPGLANDLGLKVPLKARIAGLAIRAMRWCGLRVTFPGGDPDTVEAIRELVFELAQVFDEEVFRIFWGQLRTGMSMYEAQTGKDGWLLFRDMFRGFADPRILTDACGITLTEAQAKKLAAVSRAEADAVFASMKEFYKIRARRDCDESFSAFLDAVIDDLIHSIKATIALRQELGTR